MSIDPGRALETVGVTALGIAFARAQESRRDDRLFDDPYAERFVAAGAELSPLAGAMTGPRSGQPAGPWEFLTHHVAVRTRFFDDYLLGAGCRQVVLLAAGLDARALRLAWPPGTRVFELDQAPVLEFKARVLGGRSAAGRTPVAVDLREDWGPALLAGGFEPGEPAAWLIEGLLPALTAAESDRLLARVGALAAPASRLACDDTGDTPRMQPLLASFAPEFLAVWKGGPDEEPVAWLARHGWDGEVLDQAEASRRYGRLRPPALDSAELPHPRLVTARRA